MDEIDRLRDEFATLSDRLSEEQDAEQALAQRIEQVDANASAIRAARDANSDPDARDELSQRFRNEMADYEQLNAERAQVIANIRAIRDRMDEIRNEITQLVQSSPTLKAAGGAHAIYK